MASSTASLGSHPPPPRRHTEIVLFYQYFLPSQFPSFVQHAEQHVQWLWQHQKKLCGRLRMRGRLLLSIEGINGSLSAENDMLMQGYITTMQQLTITAMKDNDETTETVPPQTISDVDDNHPTEYLFAHVDWKRSSVKTGGDTTTTTRLAGLEPFPDLKISIVREIVSTGGAIDVVDIQTHGGTHLTPREFHQMLEQHQHQRQQQQHEQKQYTFSDERKEQMTVSNSSMTKPIVLVDVRNTFEYDIGHFVHPNTHQAAVNPETTVFSTFASTFCDRNATELQQSTVLMYCTGGIRCEKASAMLKKRGVQDVYQLQGGIHRYLEEFGNQGFFRGKNFVFDQRVAMKPADCKVTSNKHRIGVIDKSGSNNDGRSSHINGDEIRFVDQHDEPQPDCIDDDVIGSCIECSAPYDELSGAHICTVCRDLVLVCPTCDVCLREYHCRRHAAWKDCYFTFLEVFDVNELVQQRSRLSKLRDQAVGQHKNVRKTLTKQMDKITQQMQAIELGECVINRDAPRRCRTCMEARDTLCDGLCWGFWKRESQSGGTHVDLEPIMAIQVGDIVEPGPHWNALRHGPSIVPSEDHRDASSESSPCRRHGLVVDVCSWGTGGSDQDAVSVLWLSDSLLQQSRRNKSTTTTQEEEFQVEWSCVDQPQIYRWGFVALNGTRLYDVQKVENL